MSHAYVFHNSERCSSQPAWEVRRFGQTLARLQLARFQPRPAHLQPWRRWRCTLCRNKDGTAANGSRVTSLDVLLNLAPLRCPGLKQGHIVALALMMEPFEGTCYIALSAGSSRETVAEPWELV
jgi:hypothetical protein